MFLEQPRPHLLPGSRPPAINLALKCTGTMHQRHYALCDILEHTGNKLK